MPLKRVVITGMGALSPFGRGVDTLMNALLLGESGVRILPELADIRGIRTRVAALVPGVDPGEIPRKYRRSMSAMSVFASLAAGDAIAQAVALPSSGQYRFTRYSIRPVIPSLNLL